MSYIGIIAWLSGSVRSSRTRCKGTIINVQNHWICIFVEINQYLAVIPNDEAGADLSDALVTWHGSRSYKCNSARWSTCMFYTPYRSVAVCLLSHWRHCSDTTSEDNKVATSVDTWCFETHFDHIKTCSFFPQMQSVMIVVYVRHAATCATPCPKRWTEPLYIWEDFCNEGSSKLEMSMCKVEEALQALDDSY